MTDRHRSRLISVTAALSLAVTGAILNTGIAHAEPECLHPGYDFDSDGTLDPVIGSPGSGGADGRVEVRISNEGSPIVASVTGPAGFGSAVAQAASYENEGDDRLCSQLLVGSPRETVGGQPDAGAIYSYYWDSTDQRFVQRGRYAPGQNGVAGQPQAGARFGAAIGSEARPEEEIDPVPTRIWVGAPRHDVGDHPDAGRVFSFVLKSGDRPPAEDNRTLDLADPGVPGSPSDGARLGAAVSVSHSVVAIGAPAQKAGGVAAAGAVLIASDRDSDPPQPTLLSQASDGFPGTAEKGDRLGAAVHVSGRPYDDTVRLLIGAPGEDLGSIKNAGTVDVVPLSTAGSVVGTIRGWDQDSAQMNGTAEAGDRFGSAVSSFQLGEATLGLAGVPGEDIGKATDAGMVQVVGGAGGWSQATHGIPGNAEDDDQLGASLAGTLIGVPGENGTGAVISGLPIEGGTAVRWMGPGPAGARYGDAVAP